MYRRHFLVASINLVVPVSICHQPASLWVSKLSDYLISRLSRLIFDQISKLLLTYWLHASKYFCFTLQWRENFFNSLPVIHISDSTLLMQETVISFEEVMQTKLKVKLCIFQSLSNPCILQKRVVFQAKSFFLTVDLSFHFVVFFQLP